MPTYFVTLCAGLEEPVADEVRERLPGASRICPEYGRVLFDYDGAPTDLLKLRTVNRVCVFAGSMSGLGSGRSALSDLTTWAAGVDFSAALDVVRQARHVSDAPHFRVTGQRTGTHDFNSMEAAGAVGAGICATLGWPVKLVGFDIDVRLRIADGDVAAGIALSKESLHHRLDHVGGKAPLMASVAHALVRILGQTPPGPIVDPMCGTGTIPIESFALRPDVLAVGGDTDADALGAAQRKIESAKAKVMLFTWDARRLPLRYQSVAGIVANLPFGRRVGSHRRNLHLYPGFVRELQRVLKPGARAVLLTLEKRLLERLISKQHRLRLVGRHNINLAMLKPSVYEILKLP